MGVARCAALAAVIIMNQNPSRASTLALAVIVGLTGASLGLAGQASATTVCIEDLPLGCIDTNKGPAEHVRDLKESAHGVVCDLREPLAPC